MRAARELSPELRAVMTEAILGLLFASGLRIGEAPSPEPRAQRRGLK